jgi:hypothetical protein
MSYHHQSSVSYYREMNGGEAHLDNDNRLLDDIAHARRDEVEENVDAAFGRGFDFDCAVANGFDCTADKVDVGFRCVPKEGKGWGRWEGLMEGLGKIEE